MSQTVLILGASGRFGRHAATAFQAQGWTVRRFDRARDDLMTAARGTDVIVAGWNLAYPDWPDQVARQHEQIIEAARATGATVLLPGNVYVFGPDTPAPWGSDTPHRATNPMGRIRIEMEDAYRQSGVRTILLRAGDFLDTEASGNWFDKILTKSLDRGVFRYPGRPDIPHAWAWLPDFARAAVNLAEIRDTLPTFIDIPFPGYTLSGQQMADTLARVSPGPVRLKRMSWLPLVLASPVWPMGRCLREMRYLWDTPHWLDPCKFAEVLPDFQSTPVERALARAIDRSSVQRQIDPDQTVPAGL